MSCSQEEPKVLKPFNIDHHTSLKQRRSSSIYGSSFERPKNLLNDLNRLATKRIYTKSDSLEDIKQYILSLPKSAINQRDIFGRTLLHIAVSSGKLELVEALLEHPKIDLTLQDFESGWTALHRAFYHGYILSAVTLLEHCYDCITVRDRCKQQPLDLLPISPEIPTIPVEKHWLPQVGGSHLLSFGSNTNHTLGFADPDDRAFPQVVELRRDNEIYCEDLFRQHNEETVTDMNDDSSDDTTISNDNDIPYNFAFIPSSPRLKFRPVRIKDIQTSKLHSAVITTDPSNNLLMCGLATGGRLGLGPETVATQFTYQAVPRFNRTKVLSVALGLDHTLALTTAGVYSWGSNQYGQLGTGFDQFKDEKSSIQYLPRKVASDFGFDKVQGIAASKFHSVVYTDEHLYFWGKNIGQMGVLPSKETYSWASNMQPDFEDGGVIIPIPQIFSRLPSPVQMAVACDIATICLLQNSSVWVFMNGSHFRVHFPFHSMPANHFEHYQPTQRNTSAKIIKIACSPKGAVCALDDDGTVYSFSLSKHYIEPAHLDETVKVNQIAKSLKVCVVWNPKTLKLVACDADIADDECIIVCTGEGSVWKRIQKGKVLKAPQAGQFDLTSYDGKKKYHYEKVPYLNKVYQVRCDRLFSSFAAIRDDDGLKHLTLDQRSISDDLANLAPFTSDNGLLMQAQYLAKFSKRRLDYSFNRQRKQKDTGDLLLQDDIQFSVGRSLLTSTQLIEVNNLSDFCCHPFKCLTANQLRTYDSYFDVSANTRRYDLAITLSGSDTCIPVHKFVLLARIPSLRCLFDSSATSVTGLRNLEITYDSTPSSNFRYGKLIVSGDIQEICLCVLVYYIYTDEHIKPWDDWIPPEGVRKNRAYEDFHRLVAALDLYSIKFSLNSSMGSQANLGKDLLTFLRDKDVPESFLNTDVNVNLEGTSVALHSYIISSRSAFFATALSERWNAATTSNTKLFTIDLSHIPDDIFDIVIKYLYGDKFMTAFDDIGSKFQAPKHFVAFVLKVLDIAGELTLVKLFQACEVILADFSKY